MLAFQHWPAREVKSTFNLPFEVENANEEGIPFDPEKELGSGLEARLMVTFWGSGPNLDPLTREFLFCEPLPAPFLAPF